MMDMDILTLDVEDIYLGNLGTVDTDLKLPKEGKRGSRFRWESSEILFISHDGKVTRPTHGVGNREVMLTVTAAYGNESIIRQFSATVLEESMMTKIIRTVNIDDTIIDETYHLPEFCVVELDNQTYSTASVKWSTRFKPNLPRQVITGTVEETDIPVSAILTYRPEHKFTKVPAGLVSKATALEGPSLYKEASDRMITYLKSVEMEQLVYSFRDASGLPAGEGKPMTGWDAPECNLRGHTTGHYLSAFSLAYYATKDDVFRQKIDYLVHELGKCQDAFEAKGMHKGFLSAYNEAQFDLLEQYITYPAIWAPYYTLEKILNGLLDCHKYGGNAKALVMAVKIGDWVNMRLSRLPVKQLKKMWSIYIAGEFGFMISALIRLYQATGNKKYVKTALLFENDKLFVPMRYNYDTLDGVHANQHIPQIIGALDIYEATGNEMYLHIAENFWNMVVRHHAYSIGGVGETEMFKLSDKISGFLTSKTAESCASHNMLKLTKKLYNLNPKTEYFEYYENTLHNHLLSAASHKCDGGTAYFMPLGPGGRKKFDTTENTCCHGTGLETLLRFQKDIYSFSDDACYVNLFYPSTVNWLEKNVSIRQSDEDSQISISIIGAGEFSLKIRVPTWMSIKSVAVDGTEAAYESGEYIVLKQIWQNNIVTVKFKPLTGIRPANDNHNIFSITYGRDIMAYCGKETDFIEITESEMIESCQNGPELLINGVKMKPFNKVRDEAYHVYFRKV